MTASIPGAGRRRVYLHIGAPKTGTTFIQGVLWANREALEKAGVHLPGEGQWQHYQAGQVLRDMPFNPDDPGPDWTGAWDNLTQQTRETTQPVVVLSDERLASLTPAQVERAAADLRPREVHVIYATRELGGLLPSEWQEYLKHGSVQRFNEWAYQVLVTREGPADWFWRVHDLESVVRRWATAIPLDRIHIITMPPPTAPRDEMWRRFTQVLGCDASVTTELGTEANRSLGLPSAEVLRRVNGQLSSELPKWHRAGVVRDLLANQVLNPLGPRSHPPIPVDLIKLIEERTAQAEHSLLNLGCDVVGDPSDLTAPHSADGAPDPDSEEVAEVATQALARLVDYVATMRDELRAERIDRHNAEVRLAAEKVTEINRALSEQEAAFWRDHPMARRLQTAKERIVRAESSHRAIAATLDGYRRIRGSRAAGAALPVRRSRNRASRVQ